MVALRKHPSNIQITKLYSLGALTLRAIMQTVDPRTGTFELTDENMYSLVGTVIDGAHELDLIR